MKNTRWIGGMVLILTAAGFMLFDITDHYLPAAITLLIVGISLMGTSRRAEA